jgi:hypothetical protein
VQAVPQGAAKCRRANHHGVQRHASGMCILPSVRGINHPWCCPKVNNFPSAGDKFTQILKQCGIFAQRMPDLS